MSIHYIQPSKSCLKWLVDKHRLEFFILLAGFLFSLHYVGAHQNVEKGELLVKAKPKHSERQASVADLRLLYESAISDCEKRSVGLRVADSGFLHPRKPVSSIDSIFGTQFSASLPSRKEGIRVRTIRFSHRIPETNDENVEPIIGGCAGWYLTIKYNWQGVILSFYFSNLYLAGYY